MKHEEVEKIASLTLRAFSTYYPTYSKNHLQKEIKILTREISELNLRGVSKYFVLTKGDTLIGSVALTVYNNQCYLNSMVIDPQLQKIGYGTILLESLIKEANEKEYGNIYLYANQAGERLYEAKGFTPSFKVTPLKLKYIKPVNFQHEKPEFNFELPLWIKQIELERYGPSRLNLYDYLFSQEIDLLSIGENAFCTLRGHTIGILYAVNREYAINMLHEAWKLGGEYFNAFQTRIFDNISSNISFHRMNDLSCTRMFLKREIGSFDNFYGILSFGFG